MSQRAFIFGGTCQNTYKTKHFQVPQNHILHHTPKSSHIFIWSNTAQLLLISRLLRKHWVVEFYCLIGPLSPSTRANHPVLTGWWMVDSKIQSTGSLRGGAPDKLAGGGGILGGRGRATALPSPERLYHPVLTGWFLFIPYYYLLLTQQSAISFEVFLMHSSCVWIQLFVSPSLDIFATNLPFSIWARAIYWIFWRRMV